MVAEFLQRDFGNVKEGGQILLIAEIVIVLSNYSLVEAPTVMGITITIASPS